MPHPFLKFSGGWRSFGWCMATEDALRELAANAAPSNFSLTVVRSHQSLVPVWELVDFVGRQFAPTRLLFSQNQEVPNAYTTHQVHQHQSHRRGVRAVRGPGRRSNDQ